MAEFKIFYSICNKKRIEILKRICRGFDIEVKPYNIKKIPITYACYTQYIDIRYFNVNMSNKEFRSFWKLLTRLIDYSADSLIAHKVKKTPYHDHDNVYYHQDNTKEISRVGVISHPSEKWLDNDFLYNFDDDNDDNDDNDYYHYHSTH